MKNELTWESLHSALSVHGVLKTIHAILESIHAILESIHPILDQVHSPSYLLRLLSHLVEDGGCTAGNWRVNPHPVSRASSAKAELTKQEKEKMLPQSTGTDRTDRTDRTWWTTMWKVKLAIPFEQDLHFVNEKLPKIVFHTIWSHLLQTKLFESNVTLIKISPQSNYQGEHRLARRHISYFNQLIIPVWQQTGQDNKQGLRWLKLHKMLTSFSMCFMKLSDALWWSEIVTPAFWK